VFDVAIVGAGFAGLVAANRAAQFGLKVIVLEQGATGDYLCNSRIATGVVNFAHSNPELSPEYLVQAAMGDTEGHADPAIARAMADVAGRGLAWLREEGAEFVRRGIQGKQSFMMAPAKQFRAGLVWKGDGPDVFLNRLRANLQRRGGQVLQGARATRLIMQDGRCAGVETTSANGIQHVEARSVVLADGGFQANSELLRRFITRHPESLVQRNAGTGQGDAILMAEAIGAKLIDMDTFYGHLLAREAIHNPGLWPYPTLDSLTAASVLIGRQGNRLFDEGIGGITLSNRIASLDDPLSTTIVFDQAIWDTAGRDEMVPPNPSLQQAGGTLVTAGSLAELAQAIGVGAIQLERTVANYNAALREGRAHSLTPPRTAGQRFGVSRSDPGRVPPRPVEQPPFYAVPLSVGISCTLGGIAIDPSARALDNSGQPIPGLYAAGSTTGGLEGGPIAGYIGGLAKACFLGLIAAEAIAAGQGATPLTPSAPSADPMGAS
jgi:fumarate reductase flavoprotein subunit